MELPRPLGHSPSVVRIFGDAKGGEARERRFTPHGKSNVRGPPTSCPCQQATVRVCVRAGIVCNLRGSRCGPLCPLGSEREGAGNGRLIYRTTGRRGWQRLPSNHCNTSSIIAFTTSPYIHFHITPAHTMSSSVAPTYLHLLKDKKVVVIGGSSGIGFSVASALVEEGAHVVIASSSQERVDAAVARLSDPKQQYNADEKRVEGRTVNLKGEQMEVSLGWAVRSVECVLSLRERD